MKQLAFKEVRCCKDMGKSYDFTVGKTYPVLAIEGDHFQHADDKGVLFWSHLESPYFDPIYRGWQVEVDSLYTKRKAPEAKPDMVNSPNHYALFDDLEAIDVIARSMTVEMFRGYCFGNLLKYRLRVGKKDSVEQELAKADKYNEIFEKHKGKCYDAS